MKVEDIPTETFNRVIQALLLEGWRKTYVYDGFDAWIDYGEVKLQRDDSELRFTWDNWTEGQVEGDDEVVQKIRTRHGF